jgi:hypothetical protein
MTTSMDPAEKATKFAQAVSEGLNCLGVFLCGPALRKYGAPGPDLLRRWEVEYAPVFQNIELPARGGDSARFRAALAKISSLVASGVDLDATDQLASLRAAIRDLLTAMRFPVPVVPSPDAAVCELHGTSCPALADQRGP